jgi:flagellar protein FlgJ
VGAGTGAEKARLREATQQFEAFFVGYLLKQMRKGVDERGGVLPPSEGEKIFRDMMDDEVARAVSVTSRMGIADLLYSELAPTLDRAAGDDGFTKEGKKER